MQKGAYILSVMEMNASGKRLKRVGAAAFCSLLSVLLIAFSQSGRDGAAVGAEICARVLVPSLFPFMAVSGLFIKTGVCAAAGQRVGNISRAIFGVSGALAPVILLSLIGGYPVGARGIRQLYEQGEISEREAKKTALFAVCAGPGFLLNFVGMSLYGSMTVGLVLLAAGIASSVIIGIAINIFDRYRNNYISNKEIFSSPLPFSRSLTEAVTEAAGGMFAVCAMVVFFSAFTEIFRTILPEGAAADFIFSLLEISASAVRLSECMPIEAVAFALGFGGICVHFQIFAALGGIKVNKPLFFFIRILQGLLTAALTKAGAALFFGNIEVFSTSVPANAGVFGGSALSATALIAVAVCFLLTLKKL